MAVTHFAHRFRVAALLGAVMFAAWPARATDPDWIGLPIRSQQEFDLGLPGGEAEQHPHSITRSVSNPDVLYLSHDVGGVWRSDDGGMSWTHPSGAGLYLPFGQSVQVDPADPDTVFAIADNSWNWLGPNQTGLYRSQDGGESWQFMLHTTTDAQRFYQQNIAYAPTSVSGGAAQRWYAAFPDNALYRSDNAGDTWTNVRSLSTLDELYGMTVHPADANRIYLWSSSGLYTSANGGSSLTALGNLPSGDVTTLSIAENNPNDIFAAVRGRGLYRSLNGGQTFSLYRSFNIASAFVHPTDRSQIYLIGQSGASSLATSNGGQTWVVPQTEPFPGLGRDGSSWKGKLEGNLSAISPDPRDPSVAAGYSRATLWHTTDSGVTFQDGSAGFTGYNWAWFTTVSSFDVADPNRFTFFNQDVGMTATTTGGDWFTRGAVPYGYIASGQLAFYGMYSGDTQPITGSPIAVAAAGMTWNTKLIRTTNGGQTWTIVDNGSANHLFVRFHPDDPNVVYAGAKRSDNAGASFHILPELAAVDGEIVGMALSQPDTIYALNRNRNQILRSNDRGETWATYANTSWTMKVLDSLPTFCVDPGDADRIYTIDSAGDVIRFDGSQWTSLSMLDLAGDDGTRNFVRQIAVDPRYPDILYAGTQAAGLPFLFRSLDGGLNWDDITGNLPRIGIGGLAVHPLTGDVFIGGAAGTHILPPPYVSPDSIYYRLSPAPVALLGDANNDGVVSADDFTAVQSSFGNTGDADGFLLGDANDDGIVSADDFAAIQSHFGNVLANNTPAFPIPEPATLVVFAAGLLALRRRTP